jgi:hypothetical protein
MQNMMLLTMINQNGPQKIVKKNPLGLDLYGQLEIPQEYMAFEVVFENIDQEESDNLESDYMGQGYKIFSANLVRSNAGLFTFTLIVAKAGYTF